MKPYELPPPVLGLDVVSPETAVPDGGVRKADNVVILEDGSFQSRPGYGVFSALPGAHSFWRSRATTRTFVAAGETLYEFDVETGLGTLFTGLPPDVPLSYEDVGPDTYFTCAGVMRKVDPDGNVRTPGVANLSGGPALTASVGNLTAGTYAVAYSLVNDRGEESPISPIAWIELPSGGGVLLSGIQAATDAIAMRLYVSAPNGGTLYHHATRGWASTSYVVDATLLKPADRMYRQILPSGNIVRLFNGRLYVVDGKNVWVSDPLDYGVSNIKSGWMTFKRTLTLFEPVSGGIFVGMRERTIFLRGDHGTFVQVPASAHGALQHSGGKVAADHFHESLAPNRTEPVAAWLSDVGLAIGRPDGSIAYPQADRICGLDGGVSRPLFMQSGGIKQSVFCVESMVIGTGGATDSTI